MRCRLREPENPSQKAKQIRETLQKDPTPRARAFPLIPFPQTFQKEETFSAHPPRRHVLRRNASPGGGHARPIRHGAALGRPWRRRDARSADVTPWLVKAAAVLRALVAS